MKIKSFLNKNILRSKVVCGVFGAFVAILGFGMLGAPAGAVELPENILNDRGNVSEQVKYLSDMEYSKASVGWGTLTFDKTQDNASLILRVDGYSTAFRKGIWAHATSTIEYDLSNYSDFAYFTTYYGLNTTSQAGNGVKFYIYTSTDGENWTLRTEENPEALKGASNAKFAKIDIRGAKYLRLYADAFGSNASDHAVWADSKLIKEGYTDEITIPVATLDEYIKEHYAVGPVSEEMSLPLLQRTFISRVGQYTLRSFVDASPENYETLRWFIHNEEALRLWIVGGAPNGSYERALQVLSQLYTAHKEDLETEELTSLGNKYKDLYLKMMLALSLTHSANVGLWIGGNQFSSALTRYEIYKDMHRNNRLMSNEMFENYTVEEMRWVMSNNIDDEEIQWLRDYSYKRYPDATQRFNPYAYVRYTTGYGYYRPFYYSAENYAKWDAKYNLSNYNITYLYGKPKLWIVFEEGAVCGGISKTAANLYGVWGVPASVVGQPGHAAYIYYYNAGGGKGAWQLSYNVTATGWANTSGYTRMPNDWGNLNSGVVTNGASIKSASYFFLAQEAQNEYEKYEKSKMISLLAYVYRTDRAKLEEIYRSVLAEEAINWDAWLGLVNLAITDPAKTEDDLIGLAEEIASVYTYQPLPMYDLTRRIGTKITSSEYKGRLMIIQNRTLKQAQKATAANTVQHKEVPVVASALLGEINSEIASFSFNGANANKIVLSKQLQSTQVNWEYSLDGGQTWKDVHEHSVALSAEEVASITDRNDVKVHINGLPLTDANIYTIDITKRSWPGGVTINDEEDRILGVKADMEWSLNPAEGWNSFATTNPVFSGDVRVYVRVTAAGTQLASDPVYYTFKENNTNDEKWYVQSKNLSVVEVNATGGGAWANMLDGNPNTYWYSRGGYFPAYATVKINEPKYISGIDFQPSSATKNIVGVVYGVAKKLNIYTSLDGQTWELAASQDNLGNNTALKHIDFAEPKQASFVKVECESIYPTPDNKTAQKIFTVSMIKLYENVIVAAPRAEVNYNITTPTNQDVVAELVNMTRPITVTNNDGKTTYTFTENGEFTFEFVDEDGQTGSATAKVDWIDKVIPTVEVVFSTTEPTNEEVVATLTGSKPNMTVLSDDVPVATNPDGSRTITFEENDSVEVVFQDAVGNVGLKTITVDWIDKTAPTAEISYSTLHLTDEPVTAEMTPSEEVTILNNDGSPIYTFNDNGEFTFEFVDKAGNVGTATAIVSWIARMPEYTLEYSTTEPTRDDVEVVLTLEDGYRVVNNDGSNKYLFTENGTFGFQYIDGSGIVGQIDATVDWIDREAPTAELEYIKTRDLVTVKVVNPSEEITFAEGDGTYEYTENGEYEIVFYDRAGNEGRLMAVVDSIGKDPEEPDPGEDPNPEEPEPEEPEEPEEPSTPDDSNQGGNNNGGNANGGNGGFGGWTGSGVGGGADEEVKVEDEGEEKVYTLGNIKVAVPAGAVVEGGSMKVGSFEPVEGLRYAFGRGSEYYDFYFINDKLERTRLAAETVTIRFPKSKTKELIGVFTVTEGNTMDTVDYTVEGDEIVVTLKGLSKVVVSYDAEEVAATPEGEEGNNPVAVWAVAGVVMVVLVMAYYGFIERRAKTRKR